MAVERRIVTIQRRAIRADRLAVVAHIDENMRVIERRRRADAHEFLGADLDHCYPGIVVEMRDNVIRHGSPASSCDINSLHCTIASAHAKAEIGRSFWLDACNGLGADFVRANRMLLAAAQFRELRDWKIRR